MLIFVAHKHACTLQQSYSSSDTQQIINNQKQTKKIKKLQIIGACCYVAEMTMQVSLPEIKQSLEIPKCDSEMPQNVAL